MEPSKLVYNEEILIYRIWLASIVFLLLKESKCGWERNMSNTKQGAAGTIYIYQGEATVRE